MTETVLSEAVALVLPVVHAHGEAPESASGTHSSRLVHYCCLLGLSSQVQAPVTHAGIHMRLIHLHVMSDLHR